MSQPSPGEVRLNTASPLLPCVTIAPPWEALRDLGYFPEIGVATMVAKVLQAHEDRNEATAAAFKQIDFADSSIEGHLTRQGITSHIRKYLVMGREDYSETGQDKVRALVDR